MEVLLTILAATGATIIITRSWLFEKIRDFFSKWTFTGVLFSCMMCMGWWMGLIFSLIIFHSWPLSFLIPFVVSLIGWILEYLQH